MADDQSLVSQSNQGSLDDLETLQKQVADARLALARDPQNPQAEQQFQTTIETLYKEQFDKFAQEDRQTIQIHPAFQFLQEKIQSLDIDDKSEAILFLGYVNSLPVTEANNPVFPGYQRDESTFSGLDTQHAATRDIVSEFFDHAATQACNVCVDHERNTIVNPLALDIPDSATPSNVTLEQANKDLDMFKDEDGIRTIANMRQQLAEQNTINPYKLGLLSLSAQTNYGQIGPLMALMEGKISKPFDREAFIESKFTDTFQGIALVDQDISLNDLAEQNDLTEEQIESLRIFTNGTLSLGTVATEVGDLMDNDGVYPWVIGTALELKKKFDVPDLSKEEQSALLKEMITQPEKLAEILKSAPGMNESRALHAAQNLQKAFELSERIDASEEGFTFEDYKLYEEGGPVAFLERHVAQERGEFVSVTSLENTTNDPIDNTIPDLSAGAYAFRYPLIDGFKQEGERLSTSLYTDEDGDGVRLGVLNVNGLNDLPSPELYFRHTAGNIGQFDLGYLANNNGDFDGQIRTLRPHVDDHFENYNGILGLRYTGNDFELGSGQLTPDTTIGEYKGDLFLKSGLTYDLDMTDTTNLTTGGSFTLAEGDPRLDAFGTLTTDLTGTDSGTQTLWRNGFQTTHWINDDRTLGSAFTELELKTSGDQWHSNLTHVFGAFANTEENYGAYTDHTKRMDLGIFGTPDVGIRLQYDREDDFTPGIVAGWSF